jgi:aspartate/methionine/tyrosine aminotransferase
MHTTCTLLAPIDLEVGDPSDATPELLTAELSNWIHHPRASHYSHPHGEPEFIGATANYYRRRQNLYLDLNSQVCVTHGVRPGLFFGLLSLHRPGAPVGYLSPAYFAFESIARKVGMVPAPITFDTWFGPESGFKSALSKLRGGALLLNSPHNPTGLVLSSVELEDLARMAHKFDIRVVSDAVYSELYQCDRGMPDTYLRYDPNAIEVTSVSKIFRACGWRIGAVVGDAKWIAEFKNLYQEMNGVPYATQQTAASALNWMTDVARYRCEIANRRSVLVEGLRQHGFVIEASAQNVAGLFIWACLPVGMFATSANAVAYFEKAAGVKMSAGSTFGPGGEGHVRIALNVGTPLLREAVERIAAALERV